MTEAEVVVFQQLMSFAIYTKEQGGYGGQNTVVAGKSELRAGACHASSAARYGHSRAGGHRTQT